MGFSSFFRKAAPWAGAAIGFVGSGFNPGGAMAGYKAGQIASGLAGKGKPKGGGAPDPYAIAEQQGLGQLDASRGARETEWTQGDTDLRDAINQYRTGSATNTSAFTPRNTAAVNTNAITGRTQSLGGVDTGRLKDWQNTGLTNYRSSLNGYQAPDLTGDAGSRTTSEMERIRSSSAGIPTGVGAVDVSALEGFDPTAAVKTFATGAWDAANIGLKDTLRDLSYDAAKRHRMKSGWLDEDQGRVVRDTATNIQAQIAQKSVDAAAIKADVLGRGAALRVQRAGDMDRFSVDAAGLVQERDKSLLGAAGDVDRLRQQGRETEAKLAYDAMSEADKRQYDAIAEGGRQTLSALEAGTRAELDKAGQIDDNSLRAGIAQTQEERARAEFMDAAEQRRGEYLDTDNRTRGEGVMDATLRRQSLYGGRAESAQDRYYDFMSGGLDRRQANANAKADRRQSKLQSWIGAAGTAVDAWNTWKGNKGGGAQDPRRSTSRPQGAQVWNNEPVYG